MSKMLPVKKLREFPCAIRGVDKSSDEYQRLVVSVDLHGVLEPLTVVKANDPTTGELLYGVVHGLQRYNAALDAGVTSVPAWVTEMTDAQIEKAQLISAIHKIHAKPVQISRAMQRMLGRYPFLKLSEFASQLSTTPDYIAERFGLTRMADPASILLKEDKIGLANAYALARLPPNEQLDFIDRALCMDQCEFAGTVMARVKQLRDARREGRKTERIKIDPISIRVLKPNEFKTGPSVIEVGILYQYIGAKIVEIVSGHHRFAATFGVHLDAKIRIKVVK